MEPKSLKDIVFLQTGNSYGVFRMNLIKVKAFLAL